MAAASAPEPDSYTGSADVSRLQYHCCRSYSQSILHAGESTPPALPSKKSDAHDEDHRATDWTIGTVRERHFSSSEE